MGIERQKGRRILLQSGHQIKHGWHEDRQAEVDILNRDTNRTGSWLAIGLHAAKANKSADIAPPEGHRRHLQLKLRGDGVEAGQTFQAYRPDVHLVGGAHFEAKRALQVEEVEQVNARIADFGANALVAVHI